MSQSGFIAGMLLAAFVLWLAVNDRLNAYAAVLWGDTAAPSASDQSLINAGKTFDSNSGDTWSQLGSLAEIAGTLGAF